MVLREARPPRKLRRSRRWLLLLPAGLFIGAGLGGIFYFGNLFGGTALVFIGVALYSYYRDGDRHGSR